MSSHTDEEALTAAQLDQVRAAVEVAKDKAKARCPGPDLGPMVADVMAELNRPAIYPGVPVVRKYRTSGFGYLCFAKDLTPENSQDVEVLIPEETAREIARRAVAKYVDSDWRTERATAQIDRDIADYRRNGPGDSHE